MAINKRLIATEVGGGGAACTTDTLQILGDTSCKAYYKMADALDESGSYNGTPTDVNFNVEGKYGLAGGFDGSSSIINLGDHNVFSPSVNPLSFSLWIKKSTSDFNSIFSKGASGSYEYALFISGSGVITLQASNPSYSSNINLTTSASYSDGNWHHVVAIYDPSGNFKIYVDGTQQATSSTSLSMSNSSNALHIGRKYENNVDIFNGSIDQVRIFNKAITSTEVTTLYNEVQCASAVTPSTAFNTVLYTGTGNSRSLTGVGFKPDFIWMKRRNTAQEHALVDSVRGVQKHLNSDLTAAESTETNGISSFDSDGFTVGSNGLMNNTNDTYASWNWYAPTSESISASGSRIASTVKKNVAAGFSIVQWAGTDANATVGHGLNSKPQLILFKARGANNNWGVYAEPITASKFLVLNDSAGEGTSATPFQNTEPTSTIITLGSSGSFNRSGTGGMIAYCFHSVEGYSRIGSYKGTGATGNFIVTGFEPAFIMMKCSSGADNWIIQDNKRSPNNPSQAALFANLSDGEYATYGTFINFSTNGFEIANTDGVMNGNGNSYIFMAFAQDPDTTPATEANSFETKTYTGNGGTQSITLTNGMKPDLVWVKDRDTAYQHNLYDSIRGATNAIESNGSTAEYSLSGLTSFNTNGFTLGSNAGNNQNGSPNVSWNWKAADHDRSLATINQDGSITSLVSANVAAGFSIVKYKGNGTSGATFGHDLEAKPDLVFFKNTDQGGNYNWSVYSNTSATGATGLLYLNLTLGFTSTSSRFNNTEPTSSVITLGNDATINGNGDNHIAYCFTSITSYQKVGSYTGNGSEQTTTTGFSVSFLMIKRTSGTGSWIIVDNKRDTSNPRTKFLTANTSDAEGDASSIDIDFLSDGFSTNGSNADINNGDYIYLAIA